MAFRIGDIVDQYRIIQILGRGAMGAVYLVQHISSSSLFAMKVIETSMDAANAALCKRLALEARAMQAIDHIHVAKCFFFFPGNEQYPSYLLMEYLEGSDLGSLLRDGRTLPIASTVSYARQIAQALEVVHRNGIIHRDLKPGNVFLVTDPNGRQTIRVVDFGLVRMRSEQDRVTAAGLGVGTIVFAPPEQLSGSEHISGKADVYSLGAFIYRVLTGDIFKGMDLQPLIAAKLNRDFKLPSLSSILPDVPDGLAQFVDRCMSYHPDDRPTAAEAVQFLGDLEAEMAAAVNVRMTTEGFDPGKFRASYVGSSLPTTSAPAPSIRRSTRAASTALLFTALLFAVGVLAMVLVSIFGHGRPDRPVALAGAVPISMGTSLPISAPAPTSAPSVAQAPPTASSASTARPTRAQKPSSPKVVSKQNVGDVF